MNRFKFTSKDDIRGRLCDTCGDELFEWNTGKTEDIRCKACYKIIVESEAHRKIEHEAYMLHLEDPERTADENWAIAERKHGKIGGEMNRLIQWAQGFNRINE